MSLTKEQIKESFQSLARSQGFYGRLLRDIEASGIEDEIYQELEDQNYNDIVDLVMAMEG